MGIFFEQNTIWFWWPDPHSGSIIHMWIYAVQSIFGLFRQGKNTCKEKYVIKNNLNMSPSQKNIPDQSTNYGVECIKRIRMVKWQNNTLLKQEVTNFCFAIVSGKTDFHKRNVKNSKLISHRGVKCKGKNKLIVIILLFIYWQLFKYVYFLSLFASGV